MSHAQQAATAGVTMAHVVCEALRGRGDTIAFQQGERSWSYAQVSRQIHQIARVLLHHGIAPGDAVATLLPNRPEAFIVQVAAWVIGARTSALNTMAGADDMAYILADAEIRLLVCDSTVLERGRAACESASVATLLPLGGGTADDLLVVAAAMPGAPLAPVGSEHDIARIAYTGGTTGRPKGVILPHRVMVQQLFMMLAQYQWPTELRMLLSTPMSHASGSLVAPTLLRGGTVHVLERYDPDAFVDLVRRQRITSTWMVPTMVHSLLQRPQVEMPSMQTLIYGAAPIAPALLSEGISRIGPVFMQHFGQTEVPNVICMLRREEHDPVVQPAAPGFLRQAVDRQPGGAARHSRAAGRRRRGRRALRARPAGDGRLTGSAPKRRPKVFEHGWLHTGDVARRDADGYYFIVDRIKDMVISGGFNVYPREVEDALGRAPRRRRLRRGRCAGRCLG